MKGIQTGLNKRDFVLLISSLIGKLFNIQQMKWLS